MRGCRRHFSYFLSFLNILMFRFAVIVLCETHLTADVDKGYNIPGYKQYNIYRSTFGGGIKIFYDELLNVELIPALTFVRNYIEILTFSFYYNSINYIVSAIYRPPSANPNLFNDTLFNEIIDKYPTSYSSIIVGDVNFDLFNPMNHGYIDEYIHSLLQFNYFPIITRPTRINDRVDFVIPFSLLDHIWVNFKRGCDHLAVVIKTTISDHYPILYIFKTLGPTVTKTIKYRLLKQNNLNQFYSKVNVESFDYIYI